MRRGARGQVFIHAIGVVAASFPVLEPRVAGSSGYFNGNIGVHSPGFIGRRHQANEPQRKSFPRVSIAIAMIEQ